MTDREITEALRAKIANGTSENIKFAEQLKRLIELMLEDAARMKAWQEGKDSGNSG